MVIPSHARFFPRLALRLAPAFVAALSLFAAGCSRADRTDLSALDKAGVWFSSADQLRALGVNDAEVTQVAYAKQAGFSDQNCLEFVRIAHARHQPFTDGEAAATLLGAGIAEATVVELERQNQLGSWFGEAEAMHLARLPDDLILAAATRRAAGQPCLSGAKIAELHDIGFTESQLLDDINGGMTDEQADAKISQYNAAAAGHGFVRVRARRR